MEFISLNCEIKKKKKNCSDASAGREAGTCETAQVASHSHFFLGARVPFFKVDTTPAKGRGKGMRMTKMSCSFGRDEKERVRVLISGREDSRIGFKVGHYCRGARVPGEGCCAGRACGESLPDAPAGASIGLARSFPSVAFPERTPRCRRRGVQTVRYRARPAWGRGAGEALPSPPPRRGPGRSRRLLPWGDRGQQLTGAFWTGSEGGPCRED